LERRRAGQASKNTLRAVCERYLVREGGKLRTTAKRQANLERLVYPVLGDRQIDDVKRSDINALLDEIEDQRGAAMADPGLGTLRRICNSPFETINSGRRSFAAWRAEARKNVSVAAH